MTATAKAMLSSHNRDHTVCKAYRIYYLALYSLLTSSTENGLKKEEPWNGFYDWINQLKNDMGCTRVNVDRDGENRAFSWYRVLNKQSVWMRSKLIRYNFRFLFLSSKEGGGVSARTRGYRRDARRMRCPLRHFCGDVLEANGYTRAGNSGCN